ncbi:hypothetical protein C4573_06685 [Candidatus Woesearchaeota archaeon]|nr:MAG: hypothetical protein C4573_06685 [Candidatus Woesearchaeota archaeon]
MVVSAKDIKDLSPEEKIKRLRQLEHHRKEEIEALEKTKKQEIDEAEELIKKTIEDLTEEEEKNFKEVETVRRRVQTENLEESVQQEKVEKTKQVAYGAVLEEIRENPGDVYRLGKGSIAQEVEHLREKAEAEGLNDEEVRHFRTIQYSLAKVPENTYIRNKEVYNNLSEIREGIDFINKHMKQIYSK